MRVRGTFNHGKKYARQPDREESLLQARELTAWPGLGVGELGAQSDPKNLLTPYKPGTFKEQEAFEESRTLFHVSRLSCRVPLSSE